MFTFLQLSDIHFRNLPKDGENAADPAAKLDSQDYQQRELLIEDVLEQKADVGGYSAVLVAGDIANDGEPEQFAQGNIFLRNLCTAVEIKPWNVWTVPGNHDVEADAIDALGYELRERMRSTEEDALDAVFAKILDHPEEGPALLTPLQGYLEFADAFDCAFDVSQLHWSIELDSASPRPLTLRGLSSALLCARGDGNPKRPTIIGEPQASSWSDQKIHLSLCHHPHCWLLDRNDIDDLFGKHVQVRVTGHLHKRELSHTDVGIHLQAGAVSPKRRSDGAYGQGYEPTYDVIRLNQVEVGGNSYLDIAVRCRRWDDKERKWVAHGEEMRRFAVGHDAPSEALQRAPEGPLEAPDVEMREVRYKLAQLPQTDKLEIVEALGAPMSTFIDAPQWSLVTAIFSWAEENGKLDQLKTVAISGLPSEDAK
ncbi:MAG TPA: metallophosphoesterase [Solirubrobacterales bacterium]|nr:metallophosphoesterase [Solirubrobacterales bacterium]